MHTFLNRLLALEIDEQNHLFAHLEQLVDANIEGAIQAGTYNRGVERITAAGLELVATETAEAPGGALVHLVEILRRDRLRPTTVGTALEIYAAENANGGNRRRPAAEHAVRQRRALHGGALADARGRHDPEAPAHHPARQPPDRAP